MKYPNRVIKAGETDSKIVKAIQNRLIELGIGNLQGTGIYGPKTISAVKQFQSTHRATDGTLLEASGQISSMTWEVLFGTETIFVTENPPSVFLAEAIKVASSQVGVMEEPPGSNQGRMVNQYLDSVDCVHGSFWCAAFVYYCFNEAANNLGRRNPLYKTASCLAHWNNSSAKKVLASDALNKPALIKPGSIFIIDHGGGHGHTGIVEKVNGGYLQTIEGNSNPNGSSNGIGVFRLENRKIRSITKGFLIYS
jgi:hypothetical protein